MSNMAESSNSPANNRDAGAVKKNLEKTSYSAIIPSQLTRPVHLTRINNRKSQVKGFSRPKKLEKLAGYSLCKGDKLCKCSGWNASQSVIDANTLCRICNHSLASHVLLLESKSDEELDKMLSMVVDLETLFICV